MIPTVESEQALTEEAFTILRRNLPPHKVARLLSMWQIGKEKSREFAEAGAEVDTKA
jgi:hypothetical protein